MSAHDVIGLVAGVFLGLVFGTLILIHALKD